MKRLQFSFLPQLSILPHIESFLPQVTQTPRLLFICKKTHTARVSCVTNRHTTQVWSNQVRLRSIKPRNSWHQQPDTSPVNPSQQPAIYELSELEVPPCFGLFASTILNQFIERPFSCKKRNLKRIEKKISINQFFL